MTGSFYSMGSLNNVSPVCFQFDFLLDLQGELNIRRVFIGYLNIAKRNLGISLAIHK
jgi:hypothetical protein